MSYRTYWPFYTIRGLSPLPITYEINQYIRLYCLVVGTNSSSNLHQLWTDSNEELHGTFDCLNQVEESVFLQKFHYASLGNYLREGLQRVSCVVFTTSFPSKLHNLRAYGQWSVSVHNEGKESEVLGTRWGTSGLSMTHSKPGDNSLLDPG